MDTTVKLYSLTYNQTKTYLFALLFVIGNLILPQIAHMVPGGGLTWLPIYFFTLIAAYKYGIRVGLLTAILSPLVNHVLFGMPPAGVLPEIMVKSTLLAVAASYAAHRCGKISFVAIALSVLVYQILGTLAEWAIVKDFFVAIQDFRIGIPGMLVQVFGGYLLLRAIAKL
ncbi:MAG TPA: ECF transporter S component [Dysgonomonas sp.]|nr:ECF transporter S component [Dysgonomonas sp.]